MTSLRAMNGIIKRGVGPDKIIMIGVMVDILIGCIHLVWKVYPFVNGTGLTEFVIEKLIFTEEQ